MIDDALIDAFCDRLVAGNGEFYVQTPDGSYRPSYRPLSRPSVWSHLHGAITIGFPAVNSEGQCRWICFDDDSYLPGDQEGMLDRIGRYLLSQNYSCAREGKRPVAGGMFKQGHLWIFLDKPIPARAARAWALSILAAVQISPNDIETFPKQDVIAILGNCVRGPLGKHAKAGGERGWFSDAPEDVQSQLEWLAAQPLNDAARIVAGGERQLKLIEARERYRSNFTKPGQADSQGTTVLEMMLALGERLTDAGDRYHAQCPACAQEGHDKSRDNLHIAKDFTWFGCWYGGWQHKHSGSMIYRAILERWQKFKGLPTSPPTFKRLNR